jgi:hypothetical protein
MSYRFWPCQFFIYKHRHVGHFDLHTNSQIRRLMHPKTHKFTNVTPDASKMQQFSNSTPDAPANAKINESTPDAPKLTKKTHSMPDMLTKHANGKVHHRRGTPWWNNSILSRHHGRLH